MICTFFPANDGWTFAMAVSLTHGDTIDTSVETRACRATKESTLSRTTVTVLNSHQSLLTESRVHKGCSLSYTVHSSKFTFSHVYRSIQKKSKDGSGPSVDNRNKRTPCPVRNRFALPTWCNRALCRSGWPRPWP